MDLRSACADSSVSGVRPTWAALFGGEQQGCCRELLQVRGMQAHLDDVEKGWRFPEARHAAVFHAGAEEEVARLRRRRRQ